MAVFVHDSKERLLSAIPPWLHRIFGGAERDFQVNRLRCIVDCYEIEIIWLSDLHGFIIVAAAFIDIMNGFVFCFA